MTLQNGRLPEHEMARMFYRPFCSEAEIDRIMSVSCAKDYLLRLRAEAVVDHMRLFRVMRNRVKKQPEGWTLSSAFDQAPFMDVIASLDEKRRQLCEGVVAGLVFTNDPNGSCLKTEFGNIITVSCALEYFFYFMNLACLDFGVDVPPNVRDAALRIAIRAMLKTETLDFDMDPRGIVPPELDTRIKESVAGQMRFVVGHEYAHHFLGHLSGSSEVDVPLFAHFANEAPDENPQSHYNYDQTLEFAADVAAISVVANSAFAGKLLRGGILFLAYLDIFEAVGDRVFVVRPWQERRHPPALDRVLNLYKEHEALGAMSKEELGRLLDLTNKLKDFLTEDVSCNVDRYERYGSGYLAEPNTEWRGRELVDRVDYY